ncbi:MAG TPA: phosphotransferase family protein [Acidimicrobiales bacterium]
MPATDLVATLAPPAVLRPWFAEHVPGARDAPLEIRVISGGRSNEVFEVRQGDTRWTLRRPAAAAHERAEDGMRREYRVLSALASTDVPHPRVVAFCDDATVIGSVFYVMEHLDGFVPVEPLPPPFGEDPDARRGLAHAVIDSLVALHAVDWKAVGLEGFGRPEGFLERQVKRWRTQLDSYRTRDIPGIEEVEAWLEANTPPPQSPTIMHGDYHLGNLVAAHDLPPRLLGIVDWENATIGDPLLDVAYLLSSWPDPDDPSSLEASRVSLVDGVPTRSEMIARYEAMSGRSLEHLLFYATLSQYKLACMLEGIFVRQGGTGRHDATQLGAYIVSLIDRARRGIQRA